MDARHVKVRLALSPPFDTRMIIIFDMCSLNVQLYPSPRWSIFETCLEGWLD